MGFALSPSVTVNERDLTNVVPAVSTSTGAIAIDATWGPVGEVTVIDSENILVQTFGKPSTDNAPNWFTAANFLSYSTNLNVVRNDTTNQRNAVSKLTGTISSISLESAGAGTISVASGGTTVTGVGTNFIAGNIGSSIYYNGTLVGTISAVSSVTSITISAAAVTVPALSSYTVKTSGGSGYVTGTTNVVIPAPSNASGVQATATAVISGGIIQSVLITNPGTGYDTLPAVTITGAGTGVGAVTVTTASLGIKINNQDAYTTMYSNGEGVVGTWASKYPGALGNSLTVSICDAGGFANWAYKGQFTAPPATSSWGDSIGAINDEVHVIVIDNNGRWTGTAGTVLERYAFLSKASDAKASDGTTAYYKNAINTKSAYVYWMDHPTAVSSTGFALGTAGATGSYASLLATGTGTITVTTSAATVVGVGTNFQSTDVGAMLYNSDGVYTGTILTVTDTTHATLTGNAAVAIAGAAFSTKGAQTDILSGGVDHLTSTDAQKIASYSLFDNKEQFDISLVMAGKANQVIANYVIQNIAGARKDCVAFVSPEDVTTGQPLIGTTSATATAIVAYRNLLTSSSYGVIDSGVKYQYDRYNDVFRWVPLNGDVAGLCARTDYTNDAWWSPAGYNRGQIKNVVKLGYNPRATDRDTLYQAGVNPVVSFPGQGVVLFGDKTLQAKPSAFDRINVRRLFITLEKAISIAAKYQLFEFNDPYTRANFVGTVTPFLRDVQGRRGITDFRVICDETNNTGEIIDTNQFVGDIYIKPARSINFLTLNFIATRTGVSFSEVAGQTS